MKKHICILFLSLASVTVLAAGCSGKSSSTEPVEIKYSDGPAIDSPQATLLETAKRNYAAGLYSVARESFEALRNGYPYGPYVEFAEIKIADSFFEGGDYMAASVQYEEFLRNHPASEMAPYATLRAGRSYQLAHTGPGRDVLPLERSVEFYSRVMSEHPESVYVQPASEYKEEAMTGISAHKKRIMKFYKKRQKEEAFESRRKEYEEKWSPELSNDSLTEDSKT